MNSASFRFVPIAALVLGLAACANTGVPSSSTQIVNGPVSGPNALQVQVIVPPSWRPMFEDRVADAFVGEIADQFERQGFNGRIGQLYQTDQPAPGTPVLTINLVEWRMDITGNINCTFTASVQSNGVSRPLGSFNGMALRWMSGPGRFGLSDAYDQAAQDAIQQLYQSLARTGMVPAIPAR